MNCHLIRLFLLLCILNLPCKSNSQNLLPNPGFELYDLCPIQDFHYSDASFWNTNVTASDNVNFEWFERAYIHACDAQIQPWWADELGDGLIRTMFKYDIPNQRSLTQLIWTELNMPTEKDSLYYVEYTTAPSLLFYPHDSTYDLQRNVPFNLGIKLEDDSFSGVVDELDPMVADQYASDCAIGYNISSALQFGNCFEATGEERYFLYGFFLNHTPIEEYSFQGPAFGNALEWPIFTTDNFKLEKMTLEIYSDTIVCKMHEIDFSNFADHYILPEKKIVWNDGVEGIKRSFQIAGQYRFAMTSSCGEVVSNWMTVELKNCDLLVHVPNVFSPNGDQVNASLTPQITGEVDLEEIRFSIFNRWGQLVFQSTSLETLGWDGTINGVDAIQDIYVWTLEYTYFDGQQHTRQYKAGDLLLMR